MLVINKRKIGKYNNLGGRLFTIGPNILFLPPVGTVVQWIEYPASKVAR